MEAELLGIKSKLLAFREDRTKYTSSANVLSLYHEFGTLLDRLNADEKTAFDVTIRHVIILLSLSFITVGHTRHITSLYARALTLRNLYTYLLVDPAFTSRELELLQASMSRLMDATDMDPEEYDIPVIPEILDRFNLLVDEIKCLSDKSKAVLEQLSESEWPLHSQVIHLRRDVLAEAINPNFSQIRMSGLSAKMSKIQSYVESAEIEVSPILQYQMNKVFALLQEYEHGVQTSAMEAEYPKLSEVFETLRKTLSDLDVFILTRRWTLRSTDLYFHIRNLVLLEKSILPDVDFKSNFNQPTGPIAVNRTNRFRFLCTYVARRAWATLFRILDTVEPVSEALSGIHNQLLTMKRCLIEVQNAGGISNFRELYPYQMKLYSLESLRHDGKFIVDGEVPPGQGLLNGLLAQCFDIALELECELNEEEEEEDQDHDEDEEEDEYSDGVSVNSKVSGFSSRSASVASGHTSRSHLGHHDDDDDHSDHLADVPDADE